MLPGGLFLLVFSHPGVRSLFLAVRHGMIASLPSGTAERQHHINSTPVPPPTPPWLGTMFMFHKR